VARIPRAISQCEDTHDLIRTNIRPRTKGSPPDIFYPRRKRSGCVWQSDGSYLLLVRSIVHSVRCTELGMSSRKIADLGLLSLSPCCTRIKISGRVIIAARALTRERSTKLPGSKLRRWTTVVRLPLPTSDTTLRDST
jgi:hypothetical protein